MDIQTFSFNLGVKLGTFSDFCEKGGKFRLEQRNQASTQAKLSAYPARPVSQS